MKTILKGIKPMNRFKSLTNAKSNKTQKLTLAQQVFAEKYEERRHYAIFYTLKELIGRELNRTMRKEEQSLDWEAFREEFDEEYSEYSSDELLQEIFDNIYWISTEEQVMNLFFHYRETAQQRAEQSKNNKKVTKFRRKQA